MFDFWRVSMKLLIHHLLLEQMFYLPTVIIWGLTNQVLKNAMYQCIKDFGIWTIKKKPMRDFTAAQAVRAVFKYQDRRICTVDMTELICCQVHHGAPVFSMPYLPTNVVEPMRKPSEKAYLQLMSGYWGCFQAWVWPKNGGTSNSSRQTQLTIEKLAPSEFFEPTFLAGHPLFPTPQATEINVLWCDLCLGPATGKLFSWWFPVIDGALEALGSLGTWPAWMWRNYPTEMGSISTSSDVNIIPRNPMNIVHLCSSPIDSIDTWFQVNNSSTKMSTFR